jgi:hypothetical protein
MIHTIHFKQNGTNQQTILADRMPVGYTIADGGAIHLNITGVTGRQFPSMAEAVLWTLQNIDRLYSSVVAYKLRKAGLRAKCAA